MLTWQTMQSSIAGMSTRPAMKPGLAAAPLDSPQAQLSRLPDGLSSARLP
jgi:hypothetical protein